MSKLELIIRVIIKLFVVIGIGFIIFMIYAAFTAGLFFGLFTLAIPITVILLFAGSWADEQEFERYLDRRFGRK